MLRVLALWSLMGAVVAASANVGGPVIGAAAITTIVGAEDNETTASNSNKSAAHTFSYNYKLEPYSHGPFTTDFTEMCPGGRIQVAKRLFRFAVCHSTNDQVGRRKRKPSPQCPFAIVGIRATVILDQVAHYLEDTFNLPEGALSDLSGISNQFRSTFHQSFVYGDEHGHMDFASGFFCGDGATFGRQYGFICQDDDRLVNMYVPITNNTLALDNWFPRQYNLVGRKFDCDRLWRAEMQLSKKYDACAHLDTAVDYSAIIRNCHMYINEVVELYDTMMRDEGETAVDVEWSRHKVAQLKGMAGHDSTDEELQQHVARQIAMETKVWQETALHPGQH